MEKYKIIERRYSDGTIYYAGFYYGTFLGFKIKKWFFQHIDGWPPINDYSIFKFNRGWTENKKMLEQSLIKNSSTITYER